MDILKEAIKAIEQIYDLSSVETACSGQLGEYKRGYYDACVRVVEELGRLLENTEEKESN